jgi:phosphoglycerate dehydrogenase-like enzyme
MVSVAVDSSRCRAGRGLELWPMHRFAELLGRSDVVVICCPLTEATHHLFNDTAFASMRQGSYLVNVTRGPIVDGEALVRR